MSQQGGRPARPEDDWWGQLYDDSTEDTGPTAAPDTLDDRFASAKHTVTGRRPSAPPHRPVPTARDGAGPGDGDAGGDGGVDSGAEVRGGARAAGGAGVDEGAGVGTDVGASGRGDGDPRTALSSRPAVPAQRAPEPPPVPPLPAPPAPTAPPSLGPTSWERPPVPPEPPRPTEQRPPAQPAERHEQGLSAAPSPAEPWNGSASPLPSQPLDLSAPAPLPEPQDPRAPLPPPQAPPAATAPHPPRPAAEQPAPPPAFVPPPPPPSAIDYVGSGPPTYDPEPTALPGADPDGLGELVADTVLDGARYGACTLRAVSLRGDSARYRGEPRRDALLTARFGSGEQALVLVAMATGVRGMRDAHLAAAEACRWIGHAVGRSHQRLVEDIRAARRGDLKSGLQRLTDRSLGRLRASAAEQGLDPEEYTASLRCLLLPADPDCRTRVFFGVGDGGLFRLRDGAWQDVEPHLTPDDGPEGDRFTIDLGIPTPPSPYEPAPEPPREPFRFRASSARPGDALVMCSAGLAEPLRGEAALCAYLARRWSGSTPPGLAAFLADAQVRVKGYADDRTAAAVWEA
ncbi:protein phosphatase 2C domain-containing protein [Streptomyces sp. NPDC001250]|uniref:protein phosphatase 2C domain-containing protein n=1 Tax=unclassified Streptomyces TaxID=2593676 RepID=UPI00331FA02C